MPHLSIQTDVALAVTDIKACRPLIRIVLNRDRMHCARRLDLHHYRITFIVIEFDFLREIHRVIPGILHAAGRHKLPVLKRVHTIKMPHNIHFKLRILIRRIERSGCQILIFSCLVDIGKIRILLGETKLSNPAKLIRLVDLIVIILVANPRVDDRFPADLRIIIRYIEISIIAEFLAPAVLADKGTVALRLDREILLREIIIPANDNDIMVRRLITIIIIRRILTRIIHGITVHIFQRRINRRFDRTIPENRTLDRLVLTPVDDQSLLQMLLRGKIRITHTIAIWIILLQHRSLPSRQIRDTHRMLAATVHIQCITVTHRHVID